MLEYSSAGWARPIRMSIMLSKSSHNIERRSIVSFSPSLPLGYHACVCVPKHNSTNGTNIENKNNASLPGSIRKWLAGWLAGYTHTTKVFGWWWLKSIWLVLSLAKNITLPSRLGQRWVGHRVAHPIDAHTHTQGPWVSYPHNSPRYCLGKTNREWSITVIDVPVSRSPSNTHTNQKVNNENIISNKSGEKTIANN